MSSLPQIRRTRPGAPRRQARFAADRAILPAYAAEGTWYDVAPGRRRGDDQPGMVMLDVGDRREHVPASCLEFRSVPAARPEGRAGRPLSHVRHRTVVTVLSLVPLGAAIAVAASRFGWHRHS